MNINLVWKRFTCKTYTSESFAKENVIAKLLQPHVRSQEFEVNGDW